MKKVIIFVLLLLIVMAQPAFSGEAMDKLLLSRGLKDIKLPAPVKSGGMPLMEAFNLRSSAREFSSKDLPEQVLSDLLWAACGINRPESGKKTAPTARNWQDTDIFVFLGSGIYLYEAGEHKLKFIRSGNHIKATGRQEFVEKAALSLVFVSDFSKMDKKAVREDKMMYAGIHAGCITQNVYLYCASAGLNTVTRRMMDFEALASLMKLSADQTIVLAQSIGYRP
ncbi:MAG TPA: SagB/ThcOx family dehydrogenase [Candidatus Wallbacteria bacterium]|nr:SagB/ThcOx family dehydrogenase [Candidatus Wallbacteria bacterium]